MRRMTLLAILVIFPLAIGAENSSSQPSPPPGAIQLIEGYHHRHLQGIDSRPGRIWKDGGVEISYDIGRMAGNYAANINPADRVWSVRQVVNGRSTEIVKSKDGRVFVSFPADAKKKTAENYPANFYAKVSSEEDLAVLLAIALTYPAAP